MGTWTPGPAPTAGDDTFVGDATDEVADGLAGNDTLFGNDGADTLIGNDGDDTLDGGEGDDILQGGDGVDTASYASASSMVVVQLAVIGAQNTLGAGSDTLSGIENITGSAFNDILNGNAAANVLNGGAGNDTLRGGMNNDTLLGGDGDDTLDGGWDADTLNGGEGADTASYDGAIAGVTVDLANPANNSGEAAGDTFLSIENVTGSTFDDTIWGDGGANVLNGGLGNDWLNGNAGDDVIAGGAGNDNLTGGLGNDTFVYAPGAGADTINDFDAWADGGQDLLDISAFGVTAGDFASRVAIIDVGNDTVVRIDNDVFITLKNVTGDGDNSIAIDDFILA